MRHSDLYLLNLQVAAIEANTSAVLIADIAGHIIWVNSSFEQLTGYALGEIEGKNARILNSGQNDQSLYRDMWGTILEEKTWHGELVNRRRDGSYYHEEMTVTPVKMGRKNQIHFVAFKNDITRRKRDEQKSYLLSQAMDVSSEYVGVGDTDSRITYANQAWLNALGYTEAELLGKPFRSVLSPNNPPGIFEEIDAKTAAGGWKGECLHVCKDGTDRPVLLSTGALKDPSGRFVGVFGIARDITERKHAEEELLFKNSLLEAQAETTLDGILVVDEKNQIVLCNKQFSELWSVPSSLPEGGYSGLVKYVANQVASPQLEALLELSSSHWEEIRSEKIELKDGRTLDRYSSALVDSEARYRGRISYFRDITDQVKASERSQLWSRVLEQSAEGIFICDPQERILLVNTAFEKTTGFSAGEAIGKTPRILQSGRQDRAFYAAMWKCVLDTGTWRGEMWNRRKNGEFYVEWLSISAVFDGKGTLTHFVGIFSDITTHKQGEERMVHLAHHDALTGLPNRVLLMDRIDQLTRNRRQSKVALLFIDLDRFKEVNDSLGHDAGDLLLETVAKRFVSAVRSEDTVARIGGDEFVVVLQGLHDADEAREVAQKLLACLIDPIRTKGYDLTVTASIGISLFPDDASNGQELVRNADAAMYQAKGGGRNAYQYYTADLNKRSLEMLSTENALRRGLECNEFLLHYQPQLDVGSGSIVGAEALIRWNSPDLGMVMPGKFITIAEERGLIVPLGSWVIDEAARQVSEWQRGGHAIPIAVNVSAVQFRQKTFVEQLADTVSRHGIAPEFLELELTESIVMRDAESIVEKLTRIHDMGFKLSIDDFGTGYSSLSYLRRFPIDKIKIDQSFVRDMTKDGSIVRAIIGLARSLNLKVIAEGVETSEQLQILRREDCDEVQGYLFSRPIAAKEFETLVRGWVPHAAEDQNPVKSSH